MDPLKGGHAMTCIGFRFTLAITLLLASQPAHGRSEYRLGGEDGNPWQEKRCRGAGST